jgi:hypothetical protein
MMERIKIEVEVTYSYGGWDMQFSKEIEMPAAPFYGMVLFEANKDYNELMIEFVNDDYTRTMIFYEVHTGKFSVGVRKSWKKPVRPDVIDSIIANHELFKWKRQDSTDAEELKKLMTDMEELKKSIG